MLSPIKISTFTRPYLQFSLSSISQYFQSIPTVQLFQLSIVIIFLTPFPPSTFTQQSSSTAIHDCAGIQKRGQTNLTWPFHFVDRPNCQPANAQDASCRRSLFCDFETLGGGWTVVQNRTDPNYDFYKSWHEYKTGFGGATSGGYWIGNAALYEILSVSREPYELLIWLKTRDGQDIFSQYDSFQLGSEKNNYSLRLGELSFGKTDKLAHSRNRSFGTFDRDTDDRPVVHCGSFWRSGWWFDAQCGDTGNLNIPQDIVGAGHEHLIGVLWPVDGVDKMIRSSLMMVRPKQFGSTISDCADIANEKNRPAGDYHIVRLQSCTHESLECIRKVQCDFDTYSGAWTYIQKRTSGKKKDLDFWKDWDEYKAGFGDVTGDYWAGNDFIHQLTSAKTYQLMVTLVPQKGNPVVVVHDSFSVDSESNQYTLNIGAINSDLSNSSSYLSESDGRPFETWDKDTDDTSQVVCARWWQSGWWFQSNCGSMGNLNAPFIATQFGNPQLNGVIWKDSQNAVLYIKDVSMKIRPTN